jgi:hypothetical protein
MGNCLRGESSDDESLLGTESDPDNESNSARSRRRRNRRARGRVANYIPQNNLNIPDPTHYFNFGELYNMVNLII